MRGPLDRSSVDALRHAAADALLRGGAMVVINLGAVPRIDAAGLGVLADIHRIADRRRAAPGADRRAPAGAGTARRHRAVHRDRDRRLGVRGGGGRRSLCAQLRPDRASAACA